MDIKVYVEQLEDDLNKAVSAHITLGMPSTSMHTFEKAKQNHLVQRIRSHLTNLYRNAPKDLQPLLLTLKHERDPVRVRAGLDKIKDALTNSASKLSWSRIPSEIRDELRADYEELQRCSSAACYRSAIILCARMMETALHRKYFDVTGKDLLEKAPGIGLGNLIAKLSDHNVKLDPGLTNQIHLVNQVRIYSVHKKKVPFLPSESQTKAIILYTEDILARLF
jgi:hypothetical protein